jgi:hypothetical protein
MNALKQFLLFPILLLFIASPAAAQEEKPVPKDSARVQIAGCAHKRTFTVKRPPEGEPVQLEIEPGRQFTMNGKKELLAEIHAHESDLIELTGIVLRADLGRQPGVSLGGGRVRISPGNPQAPIYGDAARDPHYSRSIIDVESWRPLPADCK